MLKKLVFIVLFLLSFYGMSYQFFTVSERRSLLAIIILFVVIVFFISPSILKEEEKKDQIVDKEWGEGEYHNDFTRVGSSTDPRPVKPVDLSGDAVANARKTLNEDLRKIEMGRKDDEDSGGDRS
jgi:hypothetical protein